MEQNAPFNRVVLIDDEKFDHIAYRRTLVASGLVEEMVAFQSALEALEWFRDAPPPVDVALLDINMPRMNGFEFLEAAEKLPGFGRTCSSVVMLTTSLDPRDRERAASHDLVCGFIEKPLRPDHVEYLHGIVDRNVH